MSYSASILLLLKLAQLNSFSDLKCKVKLRRRSLSLSRAASRRSQTVRSQERLHTAEEKKADKATELEQLEDNLAADITKIAEGWKSAAILIEEVEISLDKSDVDVDELSVLWIPIG
jgi:hypothetical protein